MYNNSRSTPKNSMVMNYRSPSEMTDGMMSSLVHRPSWTISNTPKMNGKFPTQVESSGLLFTKKNPRGFNLQDRRRFVDKHNIAEYNVLEHESSVNDQSYDSSLLQDNSGILLGQNSESRNYLDYSKLKVYHESQESSMK